MKKNHTVRLKKDFLAVNHFRGFAVKMLPATDTKPGRIRITDTRRGESVIISFNYDYDNIKHGAMEYLTSRGIEIDSFSINERTSVYTINSPDFTTDLKEGGE